MKASRSHNVIGIAVLLLLIHTTATLAQIGERRSALSIGANGGVTLSSVDFDPTIKQKQLVAPTFGITLRYTCEKYFATICALQAELNYVRIGWKEEILNSESQPLPDTYQRTLSYAQIPLLARLSWGKEERGMMFSLLLGPQISFYLGQQTDKSITWTLNAEGNPDRPNNVYQQYGLDPQRTFDYGLTGGLGAELNTSIGHFTLEGRYYYGLGDIFDNAKKDPFARSAHRNIIIKASYLFDLFK